jgi:hypothetical protein
MVSRSAVTLRQGLKPHGFFCLSSVGGMLRNAAWPRLAAYRSGGGKARKQHLHSDNLFPGRCHARWCSHAPRKGKNGPQLALGILEKTNTRIFRRCPLGTYPQRCKLFLVLFSTLMHAPSAVHHDVSCLRTANSLYIWNNAVAFLPQALHLGTRTLFSFQGTRDLFS